MYININYGEAHLIYLAETGFFTVKPQTRESICPLSFFFNVWNIFLRSKRHR